MQSQMKLSTRSMMAMAYERGEDYDPALAASPDLFGETVVAVGCGTVIAVAVLHDDKLLRALLMGAGAGALLAKYVIERRERHGHELKDTEVRRLDARWTAVGLGLGLVLWALSALGLS